MPWQLTTYSILGLASACISAFVAIQAWEHRDQPGVRPFVGLLIALAGWSLVYGVQLGFTTRSAQLTWQGLSLGIGGTVPSLWLLFTVTYAGRDEWLSRPVKALLAVEPVIFAAFVFTNGAHGLIWERATLTTAPMALDLAFNTGYYVHIAFAYLLVSAGIAALVLLLVGSSPLYRQQTGLLVLGALPPFVANIAYTVRLSWGPLPAVDLTPFAFSVTGVLLGLALFQFDLLERTPIARERILEEMGDGLIVLDTEGRIIDTNVVARRVFDPAPRVGDSVSDLVDDEQPIETALTALDGRTITATIDGRERTYDVDRAELTGHRGEPVGHVLGVRDITERNEYEQRLEVTQRILRHNLRNDMNVIRGWADYLAEEAASTEADTARRIADTADDLIQLTEKTRTMTRLGQSTPEDVRLDVRARVTSVVEEFRRSHPDLTIDCEVPQTGDVTVPVPTEDLFEIPVRNLIENAIEHNDGDDPWLRVRVTRNADRVRVHVEDNGPEIPAMERDVLEKGSEGPLQHGSGVGLWLTYWSVKIVGGHVSFDRREPRGSVVTLEFPTADDRSSYVLLELLAGASETSRA